MENGDLHLASQIAGVADQGTALTEVADDIDGDARDDVYPDIGADEFR